MRYTLTLHQIGLVHNGLRHLSLPAAIFLDYLFGWLSRPQKNSTITHEGLVYYWLDLSHAAEELPFLISEELGPDSKVQKASRLLSELREKNLIITRRGASGRQYWSLTELATQVLNHRSDKPSLADSRKKHLPNSASANGVLYIEEKSTNEKPPVVPRGDSPTLFPDSPSSEEIPSIHSENLSKVRQLFRMREETPLDRAQERAWKLAQSAVAATTPAQWQRLVWFYNEPPDTPHTKFRRTGLATLLNNWNSELEKAAIAAHNCGVQFASAHQRKVPPNDWAEMVRSEYPDAPCPDRFEDLPESMRRWVMDFAQKRPAPQRIQSEENLLHA